MVERSFTNSFQNNILFYFYSLPIVLIIFFFIISCGVKQPIDSIVQKKQKGQIYVTSSPVQGAAIILDDQVTGLTTPDTLKDVPIGKHTVRVFLDGFQATSDSLVIEVKPNLVTHVHFEMRKIITTVMLKLNSDPPGATIFLDGQNTSKRTPDTLKIESGTHTLKLLKNGFLETDTTITVAQKDTVVLTLSLPILQRVLFESFANVSCVPCVAATENMVKFSEQHLEPNYVIMEYFANWPSPNDPFYKAAPKDVDARVIFYNVQTLPTVKLQGTISVDANNYDEIQENFLKATQNQKALVGISIEKQLHGDQLHVTVELFDYGVGLNNKNFRLFVAIAEDSIHLNSAPGSNGIKDFEWVFRGFLSDRDGDELSKMLFTYERNWPADWQFDKCRIIAFIQDVQNKQIIQTGEN